VSSAKVSGVVVYGQLARFHIHENKSRRATETWVDLAMQICTL
jgi:hypothetical protein